jgi:glycosyltransferase involved in cell wall biosynthesis
MEMVYVDSEPPGPAGGGIRTYLRLAVAACREAGVPVRLYTHTPEAFASLEGCRALAIGRKPWLSFPWRSLVYRVAYHDNILWEHARWLEEELDRTHAPGTAYEFCDFQGYAFFAARNPRLRRHCIVRVHTPAHLAGGRPSGLRQRLAATLLAYRERDALMRCGFVTLPSAAFAAEKLPWIKHGIHIPNPLPSAPGDAASQRKVPATADGSRDEEVVRFLYLGRIEARKGVLTLIAGFLRLAKEDPGATLALVGAEVQPYVDKVRRMLEGIPPELAARIAWEGPVPPGSLGALMARFDVLAVPSLWENSPYVYFEGMASGLLCVGSATGEMKEAAAAFGGLLAPPGEPEAWTEALREAAAVCRDRSRRSALIGAQSAYLDARRADIPPRMLSLYREAADADDAEAG